MKTCTKCKRPKQLTDFSKSAKNKDGYRSECVDCERERNRETQRLERQRVFDTSYDEQEIKKIIDSLDRNMARLCELTNHERIREMIVWLEAKNTAKRIL